MAHLDIQGVAIPGFRVKRSHRKSRTGCGNCKRRRVKCDEIKPHCTVCKRRGLECDYATQCAQPHTGCSPESAEVVPASTSSRTPTESSGSSPAAPQPPGSVDVMTKLETELTQHYLSHTVDTFTSDGTGTPRIWKTTIPALAYTSRPVRLGMLTLAAMCIHNDCSPEERMAKREIAEYYGEQFVAEASRQLRELKPEDINTNLMCSRLLITLGLIFFRTHQHEDGVTITDSAAWTWLHMARGAWVIYQHYLEIGGEVDDILTNELNLPSTLRSSPSDPTPTHPQFALVQATNEERMSALRRSLAERKIFLDEQQADATAAAIDALEQLTNNVCRNYYKTPVRYVFIWACTVPKPFVDMLVEGDSLALSVYSHWLMLIMLLEGAWWIGDMARCGIREIGNLCEVVTPGGPECEVLKWPLQMLAEAQSAASPGFPMFDV